MAANSTRPLDAHPLAAQLAGFDLPDGRIDRLYLHWSAGPYDKISTAYHFVVGYRAGYLFAEQTHDVRENMRFLREGVSYAAHTRGRNAFAIGLSALSMLDSTPHDFGSAPLTEDLIDALCAMCAFIARRYGIAIDREHVMTHAECALIDNYFGLLPHERWDLARLRPSREALDPREAVDSGDELRRRIRTYLD